MGIKIGNQHPYENYGADTKKILAYSLWSELILTSSTFEKALAPIKKIYHF